jgi:biotin transport system permease protein
VISLYLPGRSLVHRAPTGVKLAALAVLALALSLAPASWWTCLACLVLPLAAFALAGLGPRILLRELRRIWPIVLLLAVTQLIFLAPVLAATNTLRVLAVVLLAQCITRTTPVEGIVETAERLLRPFRRFGARPERVGLAMALTLSAVGQLGEVVRQVRDAQRSRGVRLAPWSWVMPVLVLSLRHADDVGDALEARGLGD